MWHLYFHFVCDTCVALADLSYRYVLCAKLINFSKLQVNAVTNNSEARQHVFNLEAVMVTGTRCDIICFKSDYVHRHQMFR